MATTSESTPLGLLPSFNVKEEDTLNRLRYLEAFNMDRERAVVAKHSEFKLDHKLIPLLERELKRFLSLPLLFPDQNNPFAPTPPVDVMWHELIIDTPRYFELCDRVYGRYLHHRPLTSEQIAKNAGEQLGQTKRCLEQAFGAIAPSVWGLAGIGCDYLLCETWF